MTPVAFAERPNQLPEARTPPRARSGHWRAPRAYQVSAKSREADPLTATLAIRPGSGPTPRSRPVRMQTSSIQSRGPTRVEEATAPAANQEGLPTPPPTAADFLGVPVSVGRGCAGGCGADHANRTE